MRTLHSTLMSEYWDEYLTLPSYREIKALGYGAGFTTYDAMWLFTMLRRLKPRRFLEIGSGVSTYYALQALTRNGQEGNDGTVTAIDPYVSAQTRQLPGLDVIAQPVQNVDLSHFEALKENDVLFIDSTHVVKIDGDVPKLYLDIVPRLGPGVVVHSHDIQFPYNTPHPAEQYIENAKWPYFWTEAMLLQAFLSGNRDFEIVFSPALLRFHDEAFLRESIPGYRGVEVTDHDTHYCSIWYRRKPSSQA